MRVLLNNHELTQAIFDYASKKINLNTYHMENVEFVNDKLQEEWESEEDFIVDGVFVEIKEHDQNK